MSTVLEPRSLPHTWRGRRGAGLALSLALLLLAVPTYVELARGDWHDEAYAHGPIVLAVCAFLAWRRRGAFARPTHPAPALGTLALAFGLAAYIVGRSQGLTALEVGAQLPIVAGVLLVVGGMELLRRFMVPLLLLAFIVPLPGFILDALTAPLKVGVSAAVAALLHAAGYPVVREGVVLDVGRYSLLVADACSGLNSIYGLLAMALVYAQLTPPARAARVAWLAASAVPIAVAANIVRVLFLVLVTYHFGAAAGQGAVHTAAGVILFGVALMLLLAADAFFAASRRTAPAQRAASVASAKRGTSASNEIAPARRRGHVVHHLAWLAAIAMAASAVAAPLLRPTASPATLRLERVVPRAFGGWRIDPSIVPIVPAPDVQAKLDRIYREVLSRTYVDARGERMMLTVAYGGDQSDALKAHRQEACYAAQGFDVSQVKHGTLEAASRSIPVTRMLAVRGARSEPVTYWFTMGERVVLGRFERLRAQLAAGMHGRVPDGLLVRVSSLSTDAPSAFAAQAAFVRALLGALSPSDAVRMAGEPVKGR